MSVPYIEKEKEEETENVSSLPIHITSRTSRRLKRMNRPLSPPPPPASPLSLNLNYASLSSLLSALPRNPTLARNLFSIRESGGLFTSFTDLACRVNNLGPKRMQMLQASGIYISDKMDEMEQVEMMFHQLNIEQKKTKIHSKTISASPIKTSTSSSFSSFLSFSSSYSSSIPSPSSLRVGCWNVQHMNAHKDGAALRIIADVIVKQYYDVIVLLEVRHEEVLERLMNEFLNNKNEKWAYSLSEVVEYGSGTSRQDEKEILIHRRKKKKEYYAFLYRKDHVRLPFGCRLYSSNEWWRSPCYAKIESITNDSSSPSLSWLIVAVHMIWGDGKLDVLKECSQLQSLYHDIQNEFKMSENIAIALLGDFNMQYTDTYWHQSCLPMDLFQPLLLKPLATTFSNKRVDCHLYDQIFIDRNVLHHLAGTEEEIEDISAILSPFMHHSPSLTSHPQFLSKLIIPHDLKSDVVYFDRLYFSNNEEPSTISQLTFPTTEQQRSEAKKCISDHRPIYADLPCVGDIRHIQPPPSKKNK